MQRNLVAVVLVVAALLLSVAAGAWWLRITALSPSTDLGATAAILDSDEIRGEITTIVSAATADRLGQTPTRVAAFIDPLMNSRVGAAVMAEIVAAGHARLLGQHPEPLRISGPQMMLIVRDELVVDLPSVTVPVGEVTVLGMIRSALGWIALVAAVLGVAATALALLARPERRDLRVGAFGLAWGLAGSLTLFGVLLPLWGLPALSDTTWMGIIGQLTRRTLLVLVPLIIGLAVLGLAILVGLGSRPRSSSWSSPISSGRYVADRRWSR